MSKFSTGASQEALHAMLDYLQRETQQAQTIEELSDVLDLASAIVAEMQTVDAVEGLDHIRVEYTPQDNKGRKVNVSTKVPESLVSTFYDLSDKMNQLHSNDPETFKNASTALHWLANNDKVVS